MADHLLINTTERLLLEDGSLLWLDGVEADLALQFTVSGTGWTVGADVDGDITLSFRAAANATPGNIGSADLALSFSTEGSHYAEIEYEGKLTLPLFVIEAYATQLLPENYRGVALNLLHQGISEYGDLAFNSMCLFNGAYLAADGNGIYVFDGDKDDDQAIDAEARTGITHMGTNLLKRVTDAYVGIMSDGNFEFLTLSDDNREKSYSMSDGIPAPHIKKQNLARGIKSKYWGFGIRNVEGSDFELQLVRLVPEVLPRRK